MSYECKMSRRDEILVEKAISAQPLSRRDKICGENIAYLTARFIAGADDFYQYQIPDGIEEQLTINH